ncbi:MAG: hypothetical protein LUC93_10970, partial [Planctomycetaceae bacterium]|nr:hypothetical protein [Planctomycetaceae bacterium]
MKNFVRAKIINRFIYETNVDMFQSWLHHGFMLMKKIPVNDDLAPTRRYVFPFPVIVRNRWIVSWRCLEFGAVTVPGVDPGRTARLARWWR